MSDTRVLHERWADYSMEEVNKIKREHCIGCRYLVGPTVGDKNGGTKVFCPAATCHFIIIENRMREYSPEVCPYNDGKGRHRSKGVRQDVKHNHTK